MTYKQYTHEIVIKNSTEFIQNAVIEHEIGNTCISRIFSTDHNEPQERSGGATIAIPGLINLHCHLIHTDQQLASQNLFPWLKELVHKNQKIHHIDEAKALKNSALLGAKEALSFGTSFIVDNTNSLEASLTALAETGLRGLIGLEIFGSDPEQASVILSEAKNLIQQTRDSQNDTRLCLSPHASYDISVELWEKILQYSKEHQLKVLSHIAESAAEEAWFQDKNSETAKEAREFWASINTLEVKLKNWKSSQGSVDFMDKNSLLDPCLLLAHGVHTNKEDLKKLKKNKVSLVTCPRSNLYLKNGLADYASWEESGLSYGIGTDSKASNPNLDLREEVAAIPGLSAERKFELLTSKAAEILERDDLGSLEAGKQGDWVVLEILEENLDLSKVNPYELALDTKLTKVQQVFIAGKQRWGHQD